MGRKGVAAEYRRDCINRRGTVLYIMRSHGRICIIDRGDTGTGW